MGEVALRVLRRPRYSRQQHAVMAGRALPDIDLDRITEGGRQTTGAYEKAWR